MSRRAVGHVSLARSKDKQARRLTDAERPVECLIYIVGERASGSALAEKERKREREILSRCFLLLPARQIDVQQPVGSRALAALAIALAGLAGTV